MLPAPRTLFELSDEPIEWCINADGGVRILQNLADLVQVEVVTLAPDIARIDANAIAIAHCRLPAWDADAYVSHSAPCSIGISFSAQSCVTQSAGGTKALEIEAHAMVMMGGAPHAWLRVDRPSDILEVSLAPKLRHDIADEWGAADSADLADCVFGSDPLSWSLLMQLRLSARPRHHDALEVEHLTRHLFGHVYERRFGGRLRERASGALDQQRLARVADFIEAHIDATLDLASLADIACLSPFHFQRSFRKAAGCTPHQFVELARLRRARERLADGERFASAARSVGFGDSRKLRSVMSRHAML